mmetsp:Transcript_20459/g.38803  ORF Transcript_20459/g.38803 Transcript_20459/m.38803 type:complete len:85 (-) Transcript_20459:84-338(-)
MSAGVRHWGTCLMKNLKSSSKGPIAESLNTVVLDSKTISEEAQVGHASVEEGSRQEEEDNDGLVSHQFGECFSLLGQGVPMVAR